jgi:hypothetical protein
MIEVLLVLGGWLLVGCAIAWAIGRASDAGRTFDDGSLPDIGEGFDEAGAWSPGPAFDKGAPSKIGKIVR